MPLAQCKAGTYPALLFLDSAAELRGIVLAIQTYIEGHFGLDVTKWHKIGQKGNTRHGDTFQDHLTKSWPGPFPVLSKIKMLLVWSQMIVL